MVSLHPELRYGVTVALQILVLSVQVRILVRQHRSPPAAAWSPGGLSWFITLPRHPFLLERRAASELRLLTALMCGLT